MGEVPGAAHHFNFAPAFDDDLGHVENAKCQMPNAESNHSMPSAEFNSTFGIRHSEFSIVFP
jgi:hypothetical protein